MDRDPFQPLNDRRFSVRKSSPTWTFTLKRVAGIEPTLSAWESVPSGPVTCPDLRSRVSASDRERPLVTGVNGPLMARRTEVRPALKAVSWPSPRPLRLLTATPATERYLASIYYD